MAYTNPLYDPFAYSHTLPYNPYGGVPTTSSNGINWVQGVEGAKAFGVPRNGVVLLMDSENEGMFYIKTTDNIGISTMRTFKYEEVTDKPTAQKYVTMTELEDRMRQLKEELTNE